MRIFHSTMFLLCDSTVNALLQVAIYIYITKNKNLSSNSTGLENNWNFRGGSGKTRRGCKSSCQKKIWVVSHSAKVPFRKIPIYPGSHLTWVYCISGKEIILGKIIFDFIFPVYLSLLFYLFIHLFIFFHLFIIDLFQSPWVSKHFQLKITAWFYFLLIRSTNVKYISYMMVYSRNSSSIGARIIVRFRNVCLYRSSFYTTILA